MHGKKLVRRLKTLIDLILGKISTRLRNEFMVNLMKCKALALSLLLILSVSGTAGADSDADQIKSAIESLVGSALPEDAVEQSKIPGIYVAYINGSVYHAYLQDDILLIGEAFDLVNGVSLNEEISNRGVSEAISQLSVDDMVVFAAQDTKRHITVFTDIDCGYCRRFHREVPALNAAGLEVRYVAFPRSGIDTSSYDKIVTVWCSDNPQQAMTQAKSGTSLEPLTCTNPVADQYQAGVAGGVRGTPTLVVDDGTVIGGYLPAEQLLTRIGLPGS